MSNSVHPDVLGHIKAIMKRLDTIEEIAARRYELPLLIEKRVTITESQIESMGDAQRRIWDLLQDTAELTALLSEAQDGID